MELDFTNLAALIAALGSTIIILGSMLQVLDLTVIFVAALLVLFVQIEMGAPWQILVWLVTAVISVLLAPGKFAAWEYALFAGVYPIIKNYCDRLGRILSWVLKFLISNILFFSSVFLFLRVLGMEGDLTLFGYTFSERQYAGLLLVLCNLIMLLFDWLLTRLTALYVFRYRSRISRLLRYFR